MVRKIALAAAAAALLAGCAGTSFEWNQARAVKVGMTEAELQEIMGKPYMVTARGDQTIWVYSHANAFAGSRSASFILKDHKVVSTPTIPEQSDDLPYGITVNES